MEPRVLEQNSKLRSHPARTDRPKRPSASASEHGQVLFEALVLTVILSAILWSLHSRVSAVESSMQKTYKRRAR